MRMLFRHETADFSYYDQLLPGIITKRGEYPDVLGGLQIQPHIHYSMINEWLRDCENTHDKCTLSNPPQVPPGFHVIDCMSRIIVPWNKVNSQNSYLALSYVWGNTGQNDKIQNENILRDVPSTIEDAIHLTGQLGYRYLWIDRYCIPQNNHLDRQIQIQNMDRIYEEAAITIIAAAGEDPHHGLPGVGKRLREPLLCADFGQTSVIFAPCPKEDILASKWNSRGWTYQEGLLSRRRLVFTDKQVYFQCAAMHRVESINTPFWRPRSHKPRSRGLEMDFVRQVFPDGGLGEDSREIIRCISEYAQRDFTNESDMFDAFKGVLAAYEREFSPSFRSIYGLPLFAARNGNDIVRLVEGLSWRSDATAVRRTSFPSWSWIGWWGTIVNLPAIFLRHGNPPVIHDVIFEYPNGKLLSWNDSQSTILGHQELGILPSILNLNAPTCEANISKQGVAYGYDPSGTIDQMNCDHNDSARVALPLKHLFRRMQHTYDLQQNSDGSIKVTLLLLTFENRDKAYLRTATILVLHKLENQSVYERVTCRDVGGISSNWDDQSLEWKAWTRQDIRIS